MPEKINAYVCDRCLISVTKTIEYPYLPPGWYLGINQKEFFCSLHCLNVWNRKLRDKLEIAKAALQHICSETYAPQSCCDVAWSEGGVASHYEDIAQEALEKLK